MFTALSGIMARVQLCVYGICHGATIVADIIVVETHDGVSLCLEPGLAPAIRLPALLELMRPVIYLDDQLLFEAHEIERGTREGTPQVGSLVCRRRGRDLNPRGSVDPLFA